MASVDLQDRVVEVFEVSNFPFHVHEGVLVFNRVDGTGQILYTLHFSFNLVELMLVINNDRIVQLLDGIQAFENLCILVVSVNLVYRVIQGLKVCEMLLYFRKIVSSLN